MSPEKRGEITINTYFIQEEEHISIELAYWQPGNKEPALCLNPVNHTTLDYRSTFLLCPPDLTVGHLEKLIRTKFGLRPLEHEVALFFSSDDLFSPDYTLSDLTCLYSWRNHQPMKVYFTIMERCQSTSTTAFRMHSAKFASDIPENDHAQPSQTNDCSSSSLFDGKSLITKNSKSLRKAVLPSRSHSMSTFTQSNRTDLPCTDTTKLRGSYFSDPWSRSEHYSFVNSPFDKRVTSKGSVDPISLSPTSLSNLGNATSVCSPRA